jgi:hypothetical protein
VVVPYAAQIRRGQRTWSTVFRVVGLEDIIIDISLKTALIHSDSTGEYLRLREHSNDSELVCLYSVELIALAPSF